MIDPVENSSRKVVELRAEVEPLRRENLEFRQQVGYWQSRHRDALLRIAALEQEVEQLEGQKRQLQADLFGRRSETKPLKDRSNHLDDPQDDSHHPKRKRGQQPENHGPQRRDDSRLPVREQFVDLPPEQCVCPDCGQPFRLRSDTEDSEQIEIDKELVVGDLPEQVVADSLFAEGGEGIEVRAVQFRSRAVGEEPRNEVRKVDEGIEQVNDKLLENTKAQERLTKQTAFLDQLDGFVAASAKSDLAWGVLDAAALEKVTLFSFGQRDKLAGASVTLAKEAKELNNHLSLLQRRRGELTSGALRTVREALLFVDKRGEGQGSVRLSYLVGKCEWSPAYTFRADGDRKQIRVECNGLIQQMSGEDWGDVQLMLSTASPSLSASGPGLAAFSVTLNKEAAPKPLNPEELTARLDAVRERLRAAVALHRGAQSPAEKAKLDWVLNAAANEFQGLELMSGRDLVSTLQSTETDVDGGTSLNYAVAGPVNLASRPDQQMVRIFQARFEGQFYHVATPVITRHVFREAEATNSGEQDLLAGPMSVYLDGQFVGRGEIPTIARGQMFTLGFGVDPQLRARRELADKIESIQGGNRKLNFKYRLIVENYKDDPAKVRLLDRLPDSGDSAQIRVALAEMKDALSEDAIYLRRQRPKGILRWEVEVPGGAARETARILEYRFSVEFDHNFQLSTLGGQQARSEFEQLDRVRVVPAPAAAPPPAP